MRQTITPHGFGVRHPWRRDEQAEPRPTRMSDMNEGTSEHSGLKEKAIEELKVFWIITLYLAVFLGAFTSYRRLILAEFGVAYLHYGIALIEALIIAKVILIGQAVGLGKWAEGKPLIVSVIYKSALFGVFVILFGILEHVVEGLVHKKDWTSILHGLTDIGTYELLARMIMLIIAFIPFFAFWEIGRVLGPRKLSALFFSKRAATASLEIRR